MRLSAWTCAVLALAIAFATPALGQNVPVQPGAATTTQFGSAAQCFCHETLSGQWRKSMHALALVDPVFQSQVAQVERDAGPDVANFCKRCHSPIGDMVRDLDGTSSVAAAEGIPCMFCHQAVADSGSHGNTSQLLNPDLTRRGQFANPVAPHPAAYSAYLTGSELCGGCHDVRHPANALVLDSTYGEWAKSSYAKQGVGCPDCHMSAVPGVRGAGAGQAAPFGLMRTNIFAMSFVGGNVAQGPADASIAMLRSAAAISIDADTVVNPGDNVTVTVKVANKGAGHSIPTGLTDERQMWLTVWSLDPNGTFVKLGSRQFGTVLEDAKGQHPTPLWKAVRVFSEDRIPAGGSVESTYSAYMPYETRRLRLVATLEYQSLPDDLAAEAGVPNPVTLMATTAKAVYPSESAKSDYEVVPEPVKPQRDGVIWLPVVVALGFSALLGVVSVGAIASKRS